MCVCVFQLMEVGIVMCNVSILHIGLKVHKMENYFGSDFEFCTVLLLVLLKY